MKLLCLDSFLNSFHPMPLKGPRNGYRNNFAAKNDYKQSTGSPGVYALFILL